MKNNFLNRQENAQGEKNIGQGGMKRRRPTCLFATVAMGSFVTISTFSTNSAVHAYSEQQYRRKPSGHNLESPPQKIERELVSPFENGPLSSSSRWFEDSDSSELLSSKAYVTQQQRHDFLDNPCIIVQKTFMKTDEYPKGHVEDVIKVSSRCMSGHDIGADLIDVPTESPAPTPSPSIQPTSFPTLSIHPTSFPTLTPTDTDAPSPAPSLYPSFGPSESSLTHSPTPRPTPDPTPSPTDRPSPDPTPQPTFRPTPFPTFQTRPPTRQPTFQPTPPPTLSPPPLTSTPTHLLTLQPTSAPTALPTPWPTLQLTQLPTPWPTSEPTLAPTARPVMPDKTVSPTYFLSKEPTPAPSAPPLPTATPVSINLNFPPSFYTPSKTPVPSLYVSSSFAPFVQPVSNSVAISPFTLTLGFLSALNSSQLEDVGNELENVLPDYLSEQPSSTEDVYITGYEFNITIKENVERRSLQENSDYTFEVEGSVNVETPASETISTEQIVESIDSVVTEALDESNMETFTQYVLDNPNSNVLRSTTGVSAKTTRTQSVELYTEEVENKNEEPGKKKPTPVEIFFGFLLIALMLLSLVFYAYQFYKRWKRRSAQKRRERQGVYATAVPKQLVDTEGYAMQSSSLARTSNVALTREDSSDSSSYSGLDDENTSKADSFARELESAVSRDERAWVSYQSKKNRSHEPISMIVEDEESDGGGFEITDAETALIFGPSTNADESFHSIISESTFPYGDEKRQFIQRERSPIDEGTSMSGTSRNSIDPPGPRSSSVTRQQRHLDDPAGVRGSQLPGAETENLDSQHLTPSKMLQNTALTRHISMLSGRQIVDDDIDTDSLISQGGDERSHGSDAVVTLLGRLTAKREDRSLQDAQSNPSARAIQQLSDGSSNLRSSREHHEGEEHMANTDSQSKSQSLLTVNIVNEVKKLSAYVKHYETKRVKKQKASEKSMEKQSSASTNGMTFADSDSESSCSSDSNFSGDVESFRSPLHLANLEDDELSSSSSDSENGKPALGSDDSRLGIFPFPARTNGAPLLDTDALKQRIASREPSDKPNSVSRAKSLRVSKPPVTGDALTSTSLSPIPATPDAADSKTRNFGRSLLDGILGKNSRQTSPVKEESIRTSKIPVLKGPPNDSPPRSKGSPSRKQKFSFQLMDSQKDAEHSINSYSADSPSASEPRKKSLTVMRHQDGSVLDSEHSNDSSKNVSDKENGTADNSVVNSVPRKSKNKGFNKIISMFEAKPKEAIFPPNESWQYNY